MSVDVKIKAASSFFYGWTIVAIGFITLAIAFGVWYSYSVFIIAVIKEFSWSRASASSIFSVFIISQAIMNPFTGTLQDRFGPRIVIPIGAMILAFSLILIGISLIFRKGGDDDDSPIQLGF